MIRRIPGKSHQGGFTLIEVLVSVVILGVGLVGIAGLQALSMKTNQSSFMRSQASTLAYDLADRMRANVASANGGMYAPAAAAMAINCKTTSGCTPQEMAEHDLGEWNNALGALLPMGQGFVCIDSTPNDGVSAAVPECDGNGTEFAIKIWWDDNRDGAITVNATSNERLSIILQL